MIPFVPFVNWSWELGVGSWELEEETCRDTSVKIVIGLMHNLELGEETCRDTSVQIVIGLMHNKISHAPSGRNRPRPGGAPEYSPK